MAPILIAEATHRSVGDGIKDAIVELGPDSGGLDVVFIFSRKPNRTMRIQ